MGYREALEAAGATVHAYKEFGSYQGDWLACVTFDGKTGIIRDYFGSCSGCDAYEAEVGYDATPEQIAEFGRRYLDQIIDFKTATEKAAEHAGWDMSADEMLSFIRDNMP